MLLQKKSLLSKIILVFSLSIWIIFGSQVTLVQAQSENPKSNICPIQSNPEVSFGSGSKVYDVEEVFSENINIVNSTSYVLGGVRVGVALFASEDDMVPAYWSIFNDSQTLLSGDMVTFPVTIDASFVKEGEYILKAFVFQGDETSMLGAMINESNSKGGVILKKVTKKNSDVYVDLNINGNPASGKKFSISYGERIDLKITTTNNNEAPLLNSSMVAIITQGSVPLGSAVGVDMVDSVKLIPGRSRVTNITDQFVGGGIYTAFAGLLTENTFQKIESVEIEVVETTGSLSWPFVSRIGLSEYPLKQNSEVVACIDYVGEMEGTDRFVEELAVSFELNTEGLPSVSETINSKNVPQGNYFSFTPGSKYENFNLEVGFFQQRFSGDHSINATSEELENSRYPLTIVDSFSQSFSCNGIDLCEIKEDGDEKSVFYTTVYSFTHQESFWFYFGIVMASALFMYLMLGRLEPVTNKKEKKVNGNELK